MAQNEAASTARSFATETGEREQRASAFVINIYAPKHSMIDLAFTDFLLICQS